MKNWIYQIYWYLYWKILPDFVTKYFFKRKWRKKAKKYSEFVEYFANKYGSWEKAFEKYWVSTGWDQMDVSMEFHYWLPKESLEKLYNMPNPLLEIIKQHSFVGEPMPSSLKMENYIKG